jgi:TPR repeat protein
MLQVDLKALIRFLVQKLMRWYTPKQKKKFFNIVLKRFISKLPAALYQQALALVTTGQCAAALIPLTRAITLKHLPSRALLAWLMLDGRKGVARDRIGAFALVNEGALLDCYHCKGVMADWYLGDWVCQKNEARLLELAQESSANGSRYGTYVLARLHENGRGGLAQNKVKATKFYQLAAEQNLDKAQHRLGCMYYDGVGVDRDHAEALRLYKLAAAQGNPWTLCGVAHIYLNGYGVPKNKAEAILWYMRAQEAGSQDAKYALQRLRE